MDRMMNKRRDGPRESRSGAKRSELSHDSRKRTLSGKINNPARKRLRRSEPAGEGEKYVYDQGKRLGGKLIHQVKYGPGSGLSVEDVEKLNHHYSANVTQRFSQYNSNRHIYVNSAVRNRRGLTEQESMVKANKNPGSTSINHIIASGTGQHAFNRATLEFIEGGKEYGQHRLSGVFKQAAAIGRMRGLGRAILREEGVGREYKIKGKDKIKLKYEEKRNKMAKNILHAFEGTKKGERIEGYKNFMKHTFDSTGNLRLGNGKGNGRVSTGLDLPLTISGRPTLRGKRLQKAYEVFGYEDMQRQGNISPRNRSGTFTKDISGSRLSSSRQIENDS